MPGYLGLVKVVALFEPVTACDAKALVNATDPPLPPPVPLTILIALLSCVVTCVQPTGAAG